MNFEEICARKWVINNLPYDPEFLEPCRRGTLKTLWEMEKIIDYHHFLLFPQCFLPCQSQKITFNLQPFYCLQMHSN